MAGRRRPLRTGRSRAAARSRNATRLPGATRGEQEGEEGAEEGSPPRQHRQHLDGADLPAPAPTQPRLSLARAAAPQPLPGPPGEARRTRTGCRGAPSLSLAGEYGTSLGLSRARHALALPSRLGLRASLLPWHSFFDRFADVASMSWVLPCAAFEFRTWAWSRVAKPGALEAWGGESAPRTVWSKMAARTRKSPGGMGPVGRLG
jgi:hypothetical protein